MEGLSVTFQLSQKETVRLWHQYFRAVRMKSIIFYTVTSCLCAAFLIYNSTWWNTLVACHYFSNAWILAHQYFRYPYRQYKIDEKYYGETTISVGSEGMQFSHLSGTSFSQWYTVNFAYENREFLFLSRFGGSAFTAIPIRAFSNNEHYQQYRTIIKDKVGKIKTI